MDGLATEALLDTGSPVSIVSLDFFLKAAAAKRPKEQSPTDWGREVKKRLAPTAMSLRSYGGADIPLVAQVSCALARGNLCVDAQLQVQQGAPVNLLLGTDTLAKLGFTLTEQQDPAKDVLPAGATTSSRQQHDQHEASIPPDGVPTLTTSAVVRLIRPARVPAGHSKVVRVEVTDQDLAGETCLIEPFLQHHREDISVPDTLVGVDERSEAAVVIANTGCAPVLLREGRIIGNIQSCDVCPTDTPSDDGGTDFQEVNMSAIEQQTDSSRMEKLLDALSLDTLNLPPERKSELLSLLNEFPYLFALDPTELGRTSLVTHRIDTGDSVPIRQQPRRVPFALRDHVNRLTQEMLAQGIVTPSTTPWASPVVLVSKRDGSMRFCVDYRKLKHRRFVSRYSAMANPLYGLTRKDTAFDWTPKCEDAFNQLKAALTEAPVLAFPQFGRPFLLETDASGVGLGAVLSHVQDDSTNRPIAYASRTLQPHERNYGISELEALGVVWAIKHFRHYGHPCTVYTDHEALRSLLNTPHPSGKLARWGMALQKLLLYVALAYCLYMYKSQLLRAKI